MADEKLAKMLRVVSDPVRIRNIATSAHIHHGKCISGNSRVFLTNGMIKTAEQIFDEVSKEGKVHKENDDHTIFVPKNKIEIFSLNKETRKVEKKPVQYVWRLRGGNTIKINLRNGFEINTTPEHRYLLFKEGFKYVEAKDVKIGDRVVCARNLNNETSMSIKKTFLELLSKNNFYANLNNEFASDLKKKILSHGIKNITASVKHKSFYHGIWQNRYNLKDLLEIAKTFSIDLNEVYDNVDKIFYRTGKQRGHNSLAMKLPSDFEKFFYLAGLFLGDGSRAKFIAGKEQLASYVEQICRKLHVKTRRVERADRTPEIHVNLSLIYMFNSLFDYPLRKKSHNIKISEFVWKNENKNVAALLRGYFDTDGCVEKSRSAVTISSVSTRMIDDLHLLLLRFGCVAIREKDNTLAISGASALNFLNNIGFELKEKSAKLEVLTSKATGSIVCDAIKAGNQIMLLNKKLKDIAADDISLIEVKKIEAGFEEVVYDFTVPETHNFMAEGMVIHNTALTDNLLAAAGLMSEKAAGDLEAGMATWQHADEQERLMTVDSANVSMAHTFDEKEFLINLIDTPGHVDFGGNVTRAMRAVDGTIVLVCASEGIMPQTETVLRQAIRERVKPVLFINKCDRLIKEMMFTPEQMQKRFSEIVLKFNKLIERFAEPEFREKWKVDIMDGSVAFGSARDNWAMSVAFMKKKGISFKDILNIYNLDEDARKKWVWEKAPLHEVLLDMVIKHLPNPKEAQAYRIPKIWRGEAESELGKNLLNCDPKGKLMFVITRILIEPRSGREIAAGRLFSGTMAAGQEVFVSGENNKQRIQNLYIYKGVKTEMIESIPCGNIIAIMGVRTRAGDTISVEEEIPFEEIKHIFEPVVTKAIRAKIPQDLPKLVEVLRQVTKEDPSIKVEINEETGEHLLHGMGELHLEIVENRIKTEKNVDVIGSPPIVVYRESVAGVSPEVEGKSPNKHNKFYMIVEPMTPELTKAIADGFIPTGPVKKRDPKLWEALEAAGMESKVTRQVKDIFNGSILLDQTRGIVGIDEVMEMVIDGFEDCMSHGPLVREPCNGVIVKLMDISLHEDAIHRGPAQVLPAVRDSIRGAMMQAKPTIFEPIQTLLFEAPIEYMGELTKLVTQKRGILLDVINEDEHFVTVKGDIPVAETFGLSNDLRSATNGRGVQSMADQTFKRMSGELQAKVVQQIRERKKLSVDEMGVAKTHSG